MKRPRVLLADDHRIVAEGLRRLLEPEFELVGSVEDGRALLEAAKKLSPDVIVVDVSMPLLNGIEATRQLKKDHTKMKVVVLTMHPDVTYAARALEAGASGYVLKHSAPTELVTAIREALRGRIYLTPLVSKEALQVLRRSRRPAGMKSMELTSRQREVLQLLAEGHSSKEIATILHVSPRTVEFHKYRMMEQLHLESMAALIQYAVKHGIAPV
jgi:DNA-binding NarL/FixJ family response regulator